MTGKESIIFSSLHIFILLSSGCSVLFSRSLPPVACLRFVLRLPWLARGTWYGQFLLYFKYTLMFVPTLSLYRSHFMCSAWSFVCLSEWERGWVEGTELKGKKLLNNFLVRWKFHWNMDSTEEMCSLWYFMKVQHCVNCAMDTYV